MPSITGSAPGKIILCGEHAVVYGQPAIALPVNEIQVKCTIFAKPNWSPSRVNIKDQTIGLNSNLTSLRPDNPIRKTIELALSALAIDHLPACEIQIHSTIPIGGGLGSSAAVSVAVARAVSAFLGHPFENGITNDISFEIEKLHHRTPSGIDNSVITYAKPVFYISGAPIEWLDFSQPMTFLIADSGKKGSTAKAVSQVRQSWQSSTSEYESYFREIGEITLRIRNLLVDGDLPKVGILLTQNHEILKKLGVSLPVLNFLAETTLKAGAYGAKLSGGGLGGNILALVPLELADSVSVALRQAGAARIIMTRISPTQGR